MRNRTLYFLEDALAAGRRGFTLVFRRWPILWGKEERVPCGLLDVPLEPGQDPAAAAKRWSELLGFRLFLIDELPPNEHFEVGEGSDRMVVRL